MVETVKIARFQNRRGLKQDLPKPLRPGEIGFATDSRQIYIGADTTDATAQTFNKTAVFEQTILAQATTESLANVQIIKFTVPHKFYNKGDFDGVTDTYSWLPTANVSVVDSNTVFRTGDTVYTNALTGLAFQPSDITVVKNGVPLVESASATILSGKDYFFTAGTNAVTAHALKLRTSPAGSEEIGVVYYGNAMIIEALGNTEIGVTGSTGFYTAYSIPSYRELNNTNVRVTPDTGVGFLGLQFKHIAVATDVLNAPTTATYSGLGNLLLSRNDTVVDTLAMTANATNIVIVGVDANSYNVSGTYATVLVENAVSGDWVDDKVLTVSSYDSGNATIVADIPTFPASAFSDILSVVLADANANIDITLTHYSNSDIKVGDSIYFVDIGADESNLNTKTGTILDVTVTPPIVTIADPGIDIANIVVGNVSFVTHSGGTASNVLIRATRHGADVGDIFTFSNADISTGNVTVLATEGPNTFIVASNITIIADDASLTTTPVIADSNVSATPVITVDLSAAGSLVDATTTVNDLGLWPSLNLVPGSSNTLYLTHSEAVDKVAFSFQVHNDIDATAELLGLTPGLYTRDNSTVKSKLETWLNTVMNDSSINIFTSISANDEFNSTGYFNTWDLGISYTLGEMSFNSRTEARDFTTVLNNIYYESVNPGVKGLMNIKTNIEFLTLEAQERGSSTTSYAVPESVILPASANTVISALGANVALDYDTFVIEYSMRDTLSSANNYSRVGTLMWTGNENAGDVVITDSYSDISNNVTGNVVLSASISGPIVTINANNSIDPSNDISMKYIVRRWHSS